MKNMEKRVFAIPSTKTQYDAEHKGDKDRCGRCGLNQR